MDLDLDLDCSNLAFLALILKYNKKLMVDIKIDINPLSIYGMFFSAV